MGRRISCPELIGRVEESRVLADALTSASGGEAPTVLVGGEAGIGKSRLLREFASTSRAVGAVVLSGGCAPLGHSPAPLLPIVEALRTYVRSADDAARARLLERAPGLRRLLPELVRVDARVEPAPVNHELVLEILLASLELLSSDRPLLVVLEDLHWADRSTLQLLALRAQTRRVPGCLLVATFRSDEVAAGGALRLLLAEFERSGHVERIELRRFDRRELVAQMTGILGVLPDHELVEDVVARSDGNPFFVEEVLAAGSDDADRLRTLHEILLTRIETLPERAQAIARILSAARRSLAHDALAAVSRMPPDELEPALRHALDRHVLVLTAEDEYTFRHALMREALYARLLPAERVRLHELLARAIERRRALGGRDDAQLLADLAHHWQCAGDRRRAFTAALAAGEAAERIDAYAEAQAQYEHALDLWDEGARAGGDRVALHALAAEAAMNAGAPGRAAGLTEDALPAVDADVDPVRAGLLRERLGRYRWVAGDSEGALAAYSEAVELVPADPPSAERANVLVALAHVHLVWGRTDPAIARGREALDAAREATAELEEARALALLASMSDDAVEGAAVIRAARTKLERADAQPDLVFMTYSYETGLLERAGMFEATLDTARHGIDYTRRRGVHRSHESWLEVTSARMLIKLGRWNEAEAALDAALLKGPVGISRQVAQLARAELRLGRGDLAAARESVADARSSGSPHGRFGAWSCDVAAALALIERAHRRAGALIQEGLEGGGEPVEIARLCWRGLQVERARADDGRAQRRRVDAVAAVERAAALVEKVERITPDNSFAGEIAAVHHTCEAELASVQRRVAADEWVAAAAAWNDLRMPFERAYCELRAAEAALSERRGKVEVAALLRSAHAVAAGLEATPLVELTSSVARRARIDLDAQSEQRAPVRARRTKRPYGLTDRELDVLRLIARGYTNPQIARTLFISPKTAGAHVSNILGKLEASGRAEAAVLAERLGLTETPAA